MQVQVKNSRTGKFVGSVIGYAIYDSQAYALVARDGEPLADFPIDDLEVISVNMEGEDE